MDGYDVAQVCLNRHEITSLAESLSAAAQAVLSDVWVSDDHDLCALRRHNPGHLPRAGRA